MPAAVRTNIDYIKSEFSRRVGNPYQYAGVWSKSQIGQGCDCSALAAHILNGVLFGPDMTWQRVDPTRGNAWITTESWRPIEVGQRGPFGTITVAHPSDIPSDAVVKVALHHEGDGGPRSHMWLECDGVRMESASSKGCATDPRAWPIDHSYANDWAYLPGPIEGAVPSQPLPRGLDYAGGRPGGRPIRDAGYGFVVRYLSDGGASLPGKLLTPDEANDLRANGIQIVSNWETTASWMLGGYQAGVEAARQALEQVLRCGGRRDRPIYFSADWDAAPAEQAAIDDCLRGCASVIGAENVGVYAGRHVVRRCLDNGTAKWAWQTYAWSGGVWEPRANIRQRNDLGHANVNGVQCDINEAVTADYGQWGHTGGAGEETMFTEDDRRMLQRVHEELTRRYASRSPFRALGEGLVDTGFGMVLNEDAMTHALLMEKLASYGDPQALARIQQVAAADLGQFPDRRADKDLAQLMLKRLGTPGPGPGPGPGPAPGPDPGSQEPRHTLYTVSGSFVNEVTGYPADVGARIDKSLYRWQPVKYPATFGNPSYTNSVKAGVEELIRMIKARPGTFALCGYSQGAEVVSRVFTEMQKADGALQDRMQDFIGAAVFGNPMRQRGRTFPGNPNPNAPGTSSRGIAERTLSDTPDTWAEYVNAGDLYADVPDGEVGRDITAVYKVAIEFEYSNPADPANPVLNLVNVLKAGTGDNGLLDQILRVMNNPANIIDAIKAAGYALTFVTSDPPTKSHITYHDVECMPGQTSLDHAVVWLNRLGAQRPPVADVRVLGSFLEREALRGFPDALAVLQRASDEDGDNAPARRRAKVVLSQLSGNGAVTTNGEPHKTPARNRAAKAPAKRTPKPNNRTVVTR
jgi:Domain of unknown function (DUF1906)/Cutinase